METRKHIAAEKKRCGSHNCAQAILHTYADIAGIDEKLNKIMQHNILKHGFTYCGIIYLLSGDERLAYQKVVNR